MNFVAPRMQRNTLNSAMSLCRTKEQFHTPLMNGEPAESSLSVLPPRQAPGYWTELAALDKNCQLRGAWWTRLIKRAEGFLDPDYLKFDRDATRRVSFRQTTSHPMPNES